MVESHLVVTEICIRQSKIPVHLYFRAFLLQTQAVRHNSSSQTICERFVFAPSSLQYKIALPAFTKLNNITPISETPKQHSEDFPRHTEHCPDFRKIPMQTDLHSAAFYGNSVVTWVIPTEPEHQVNFL